jgi:hypothetical protein
VPLNNRPVTVSKTVEKDADVIEGLKVDVSAQELVQRLAGLIAWHESRVSGCDDRLLRLGEIKTEIQDIECHLDAIGWDSGYGGLVEALERKRTEHRERVSLLEFLRDHLVAGEVYRLDVRDLQRAGLLAGVESSPLRERRHGRLRSRGEGREPKTS